MGDVITLWGHRLSQSSMTVCRLAKSMFAESKVISSAVGMESISLIAFTAAPDEVKGLCALVLSQLWRDRESW